MLNTFRTIKERRLFYPLVWYSEVFNRQSDSLENSSLVSKRPFELALTLKDLQVEHLEKFSQEPITRSFHFNNPPSQPGPVSFNLFFQGSPTEIEGVFIIAQS